MILIKPIVSNASKTARINQHHSQGHPTNESQIAQKYVFLSFLSFKSTALNPVQNLPYAYIIY